MPIRLFSREAFLALVAVVAALLLQAPGVLRGGIFYSIETPLRGDPWRTEQFAGHPAPVHNPNLGDQDHLYFPGIVHQLRSWHETGSFPLWNPHTYCGAPHAGNPQFPRHYPGTLLLTLFCPRTAPFDPADVAFGLSCLGLLRWGLAAFFAYLWLRRTAAAVVGAAAGAAVLAFGPYLAFWIQFTPGQVLSLFPAVLFCAEGYLATRSAGSLLGMGLWLAASNQGGYPQTSLFLVVFLAGYLLVRGRDRGRSLRELLPGFLAILGACGAASSSWLPFLEYLPRMELSNQRRQTPLWPAQSSWSTLVPATAAAWALLLLPVLEVVRRVPWLPGACVGAAFTAAALAGGDGQFPFLFLPNALGSPVGESYCGQSHGLHFYLEVNQDSYGIGVAMLVLGAVALRGGERLVRLHAWVGALALVYASQFPGLWQLGRMALPIAGAERTLTLLPVCAGLLTAHGLTALRDVAWQEAFLVLRTGVRNVVAAFAVGIVGLVWARRVDLFAACPARPAPAREFLEGLQHLLGGDVMGPRVLLAVAALSLVPVLVRLPIHGLCLAAVAVFGAGYPGFRFQTVMPRVMVLPEVPAIEALRAEQKRDPTLRVFAVEPDCFSGNSLLALGHSQAVGWDNADPFGFVMFLVNVTNPPGLPRDRWTASSFQPGSPLYRLLGARVLATRENLSLPGWRVLHDGKAFRLLEDPGAYPRAFVVGNAWCLHDDPQRLLRTPATEAVALDRKEACVIPAPAATRGTARVAELASDDVVVTATADGNGYLVLLDSNPALPEEAGFPGWTATVDGVATPIERAFATFRAVRLTAGEHRVVFSYRPWSVRAGDLITVGSLALLLGLAGAVAVAGRRDRARSGSLLPGGPAP